MRTVVRRCHNTVVDTQCMVTGGNKGIGFAIVKGLSEQFDGIVYSTVGSTERRNAAVEELKNTGLQVKFHRLDVTDDTSVEVFKNTIKDAHGGIDILVNNAAIAFKSTATEPFEVQAAETIRVNYFGLLRVSEALFPLLKPHARVVQVSSSAGHLVQIQVDIRNKTKDYIGAIFWSDFKILSEGKIGSLEATPSSI